MILKSSVFKENYKNCCDGRDLLSNIQSGSIKAVFFDP